ncbi:MAG: 30S ribosomal protein S20 [bacterium]|nr:30S ribosomal protein S20 [bacterium]
MAITSSAKKALRAGKHKRIFNIRHRDAFNEIIKQVKKLITAGNRSEAMKILPQAYAEIDKAAKTNYIKPNTAARKKSRLSAMIKRVK